MEMTTELTHPIVLRQRSTPTLTRPDLSSQGRQSQQGGTAFLSHIVLENSNKTLEKPLGQRYSANHIIVTLLEMARVSK